MYVIFNYLCIFNLTRALFTPLLSRVFIIILF